MDRLSDKRWNKKMYYIAALAVTLMVYLVLNPFITVRAAGQPKFEKSSYTMYEGNSDNLIVTVDGADYMQAEDFWHYEHSFKSSNEKAVLVDYYGRVTCVGTGSSTITFERNGVIAKTKVKVKSGKCTLSKDKVILYAGESVNIRLKNKKHKATDYSCEVVNAETGERDYEALSISVDEGGKYYIEAEKTGEYNVRFILADSEGKTFSKTGNISVLPCGLSQEYFAVALEDTVTIDLENCELVSAGVEYWLLEDGSRIYPDEEGTNLPVIIEDEDELEITGLNECEVILKAVYNTPYADNVQKYFTVCVTDPQYEPVSDYLWVDEWYELKLSGVSRCSEFVIAASEEDMLEIDQQGGRVKIKPKKTGTCQLYITADGVDFDDEIEVISAELPDSMVLLAKGDTYQCKVNGIPKKLKISYSVSDDDILKVSKKGKVTAKDYGVSSVYIEIADRSFSFIVSVGTPEGVGAAKYAADKVGKASYSQGKRMEEGYYDCSSLAWRSYASMGVYLGNKDYAPTAADLAKYMAENDLVIEMGEADIRDALPGDLIFSTSGGDNGRYLKIDHVGIYYGACDAYSDWYDWFWFGDDDAPEYSGRMVHAGNSGGGVYFGSYPGYGKIVMTARPVPNK